jgi:hypothetical protein
MSLSKTIFDTIENNIQIYISHVASKYNLDESELYKLWNNSDEFNTKKSVVSKTNSEDILDPELMKLNKKELSDICKSKNLPVSGTKADLIKRIVGNEMAFKLDYDCKRSFNISLDRVKDVIDFFNSSECQLDNALEIVYNKYAYDIEYTGKPKTAEKARLLEWTNTNLIIETV